MADATLTSNDVVERISEHSDADACQRTLDLLNDAAADIKRLQEVIARCYMRLQCADVPREPWHWEVCTTLNNTGIPAKPSEQCPYCLHPVRIDGSILHAGGCAGLDTIKVTRLQYDTLTKAHGNETLHVGASDWEEFGIAVRTVSQNCDMTDIARRGDWLQRELRARGFDIVRSGREDTPDEFRSAHVINVPWCQCCEARVPADHVCACEVIAEPSKEWWKCEYSGPGGQCGRDNHYARATCWYCHHPRVNAQKASEHLYVPVSSGNDRCSVCGQPKGQCSALSEGDPR